jgi:small subunit ribosomal protein S12
MLINTFKFKIKKSFKKLKNKRTVRLEGCPQKRGFCLKLFLQSPKKPNSALRKAAKLMLYTKKKTMAHIPGIGHNLQKYSNVLIRGGRTQDLPGFNYKIIRGKLDCKRLE